MEDLKPTSVRISKTIWKRFKLVCIDRDTNQTAALHEALLAWLDPSGPVANIPPDMLEHLKQIEAGPGSKAFSTYVLGLVRRDMDSGILIGQNPIQSGQSSDTFVSNSPSGEEIMKQMMGEFASELRDLTKLVRSNAERLEEVAPRSRDRRKKTAQAPVKPKGDGDPAPH